MSDIDPIQKYVDLHNLSKQVLTDRLEGIRQLEEKASRYISVLGILVVAYGVGGAFVLEEMIPPKDIFDFVPLLSLLFFFFLVLYTIYVLFTVLKTNSLAHLTINDTIIDFYSKESYLDAIFAMTRRYSEAVAKNQPVREAKMRRLSRGYILMLASIVILGIFTSSVIVRSFVKPNHYKASNLKAVIMQNDDTSKPNDPKPPEKPATQPDPKPELKPNPNVVAPRLEEFKEGFDPKAGKDSGSGTKQLDD
jgi:hypothetical protein